MTNHIRYYAEPLGDGRAIMRVDVVYDGQLVESHTDGSPAPIETVRKHERTVRLDRPVCQWFALCDRPATSTMPHPVLGAVPICDRCRAKIEEM